MLEHSSEIGTARKATRSGGSAIHPRMRHFKEKSWSKTGNRDRRLTHYSSPHLSHTFWGITSRKEFCYYRSGFSGKHSGLTGRE